MSADDLRTAANRTEAGAADTFGQCRLECLPPVHVPHRVAAQLVLEHLPGHVLCTACYELAAETFSDVLAEVPGRATQAGFSQLPRRCLLPFQPGPLLGVVHHLREGRAETFRREATENLSSHRRRDECVKRTLSQTLQMRRVAHVLITACVANGFVLHRLRQALLAPQPVTCSECTEARTNRPAEETTGHAGPDHRQC